MIVLEGPDGGGKSTLLEKLRQVFPGHEFLHSGGPVRSSMDLIARMSASHPRQVRDRHFCISEPIYGPLFGRPNFITNEVLRHFIKQNPLVILCFAPNDEMPPQEGEHDTPEHVAGITKHRQAILDSYRQLATRGGLPYQLITYRWINFEFVRDYALRHEGRYAREG